VNCRCGIHVPEIAALSYTLKLALFSCKGKIAYFPRLSVAESQLVMPWEAQETLVCAL
jgi:hypothetical protein